MTVITEVINSRGLDFDNQRKVVLCRSQRPPLAFKKIALLVRNRKGKKTTEDVVRRVFKRFNSKKGRVQYKYAKCGRQPWKITKAVGTYLIKQLRKERRRAICTSTSLQADLSKDLKVQLSSSSIRKYLSSKGYHWKPRCQKRKYDKEARAQRETFVIKYDNKGQKAIHEEISCAMDGVIVTVPPADELDRENYCWHGVTHMWRKDGEAASPELAGDDPYAQQVPLGRAIPLWGAISAKGFEVITIHKTKKLNTDEWVQVLKAGKFIQAVRKLKASTGRAPWKVLCDNESFLEAKLCRAEYKKKHLSLIHIPSKSPDLNPIESFWGWMRAQLRRRDLQDLRAGRPPLGKMAYKVRLTRFLKTRRAQDVAKAKFNAFKNVCREVKNKRGAASRS